MAHTAPPSGHHRRLERWLGGALALLGLVVLAGAILALNHPQGQRVAQAANSGALSPTIASISASASSSVSSKTDATIAPTGSAATNTASALSVVVLNNTARNGSAAEAVSRLAAGGWATSNGGNFTGDILSTAIYYDPSVSGASAAAIALRQQFGWIKRTVQKFSGLPAGPLVLVLTSDYS